MATGSGRGHEELARPVPERLRTDIGTFVVVPNQGNGSSESFAVLVVTGDGDSNCRAAAGYPGCIVARRELSFLPHTPLTLPIAMDKACVNVTCAAR